jgi:hypothetical protein
MARFRRPRTAPIIAGTDPRHEHDALHLIETARVKIRKATKRLPRQISEAERREILQAADSLLLDVQVMLLLTDTNTVRGAHV